MSVGKASKYSGTPLKLPAALAKGTKKVSIHAELSARMNDDMYLKAKAADPIPTPKQKQRVRAGNDDLPPGASPRWRTRFLPLLKIILGCWDEGWNTSAIDFIAILQVLWDHVYPDLPYNITEDTAVARVVRPMAVMYPLTHG